MYSKPSILPFKVIQEIQEYTLAVAARLAGVEEYSGEPGRRASVAK